MIDSIFNLYRNTLPDLIRNAEAVRDILQDKENHIIPYNQDGRLAGVSVINDNVIYLLCVDADFQRRGIGTELLAQSEQYIASKGFDKAITGAGKKYIMPGVPMNNGAHLFFKEHGYTHSWGDSGCYDMSQELKDFSYNEHSIGDVINGIMYRWAALGDLDSIIKCVTDAHEGFISYYREALSNKEPVLIAVKDNEVAGTLIVGTEAEGIGSIGCTATAHKHRGKGIATNLSKLGTWHLKQIGLMEAFLAYTYTDIVKLYERAGYKICMEYFMGEKNLR